MISNLVEIIYRAALIHNIDLQKCFVEIIYPDDCSEPIYYLQLFDHMRDRNIINNLTIRDALIESKND